MSNKSHAEFSEDCSICFLGLADSYLQCMEAGKLSKCLLVYILSDTLIIDIVNSDVLGQAGLGLGFCELGLGWAWDIINLIN